MTSINSVSHSLLNATQGAGETVNSAKPQYIQALKQIANRDDKLHITPQNGADNRHNALKQP